jgi:hypothetical protein
MKTSGGKSSSSSDEDIDLTVWRDILAGYPSDHPERVKYMALIEEIERKRCQDTARRI